MLSLRPDLNQPHVFSNPAPHLDILIPPNLPLDHPMPFLAYDEGAHDFLYGSPRAS